MGQIPAITGWSAVPVVIRAAFKRELMLIVVWHCGRQRGALAGNLCGRGPHFWREFKVIRENAGFPLRVYLCGWCLWTVAPDNRRAWWAHVDSCQSLHYYRGPREVAA